MKTKIIFFLFLCLLLLIKQDISFSQNNNVGIGTLTPQTSAMLDITAPNNDKGVLVPRMTAFQRLAINSPANGLLVFDIDSTCFFFYKQSTTSWLSLCSQGISGNPVLPGSGTVQPLLVMNGGEAVAKNLPSKGIILMDANSQCWQITVDVSGKLTTQSVTCP